MGLIVYDGLKVKEAEEQIAAIREEIERTHTVIELVKKDMRCSFGTFLTTEKINMLEQEYAQAKEQLYILEQQIKSIGNCYEETEQKNIKLVRKLPLLRDKVFESGDTNKNKERQIYHVPKNVRIDRRIYVSSIQHEAWLIRAIESIL